MKSCWDSQIYENGLLAYLQKLWDTQISTYSANPGIEQNCFYHAHASDMFDRRRIIYVFIHTWAEVSGSPQKPMSVPNINRAAATTALK